MNNRQPSRRATRQLTRAGSAISLAMTLVQFAQWLGSLPVAKLAGVLLRQQGLLQSALWLLVCGGGLLAALLPLLAAVAHGWERMRATVAPE